MAFALLRIFGLGTALLLSLGASLLRAQAPGSTTGVVRGTVYDSVTHTLLSGAMVQVLSDSGARRVYTATSGVHGQFEIRDVPVGRYIAGFFHEAFDVLGVTPSAKRLVVAPNDTLYVELATPGTRAVTAALCRNAPLQDSTGVVLGFVRDAESGAPLPGSTVAVTWPEIVVRKNLVRNERRTIAAKVDADGWFAMCGIPSDADVALRAELESDSSGFVPVDVRPYRIVRQDLRVSRTNTREVIVEGARAQGTAPAPLLTVRRGTARLIGKVVRPDGGPLGDAQLMVWGSDATAVSDKDGTFSMGGLPAGTYTLEVRYVGFVPRRIPVELSANQTTNVLAVVSERLPVLDAVVVYGKRTRPSRLSEIMERRRSGAGRILTREDIERTPVFETTDLLRRMPGIRVLPNGPGHLVLMRDGCIPILWVDGVKFENMEEVELALPKPNEIAIMEVYNGAASVPSQFASLDACGAVVIWTGQ